MASETKALVETATGLVVNLIVYDPEGDWVPPEGIRSKIPPRILSRRMSMKCCRDPTPTCTETWAAWKDASTPWKTV
jgi:hypothetical protein